MKWEFLALLFDLLGIFVIALVANVYCNIPITVGMAVIVIVAFLFGISNRLWEQKNR
jgi:hypothetical protein